MSERPYNYAKEVFRLSIITIILALIIVLIFVWLTNEVFGYQITTDNSSEKIPADICNFLYNDSGNLSSCMDYFITLKPASFDLSAYAKKSVLDDYATKDLVIDYNKAFEIKLSRVYKDMQDSEYNRSMAMLAYEYKLKEKDNDVKLAIMGFSANTSYVSKSDLQLLLDKFITKEDSLNLVQSKLDGFSKQIDSRISTFTNKVDYLPVVALVLSLLALVLPFVLKSGKTPFLPPSPDFDSLNVQVSKMSKEPKQVDVLK